MNCETLAVPPLSAFETFLKGSGERELSTTMAVVRLLGTLLKDPALGRYVVPIVPDRPALSVWMGSLVKRGFMRRRGGVQAGGHVP